MIKPNGGFALEQKVVGEECGHCRKWGKRTSNWSHCSRIGWDWLCPI